MNEKYVPTRKCIVCSNRFPKPSLLRIVKNDGTFISDNSKTINGRGAYICKSSDCVSKLEKQNALSRAFREKVPSDKYIMLIKELESLI